MTLPTPFTTTSQTLASFNYLDLVQGVGYSTFYAVNHADYQELSTQQISSQTPKIEYTISATTPTLYSDVSWEITFNVPLEIADAPLFVESTVEGSTGNRGTTQRMDVVVSHIDKDSNVTQIGTATGAEVTQSTSKQESHRLITKVDLTRKHFSIGEKLRVNTKVYGELSSVGNTVDITLYVDGANRTTSEYDQKDLTVKNKTNIIVNVPFEVR